MIELKVPKQTQIYCLIINDIAVQCSYQELLQWKGLSAYVTRNHYYIYRGTRCINNGSFTYEEIQSKEFIRATMRGQIKFITQEDN